MTRERFLIIYPSLPEGLPVESDLNDTILDENNNPRNPRKESTTSRGLNTSDFGEEDNELILIETNNETENNQNEPDSSDEKRSQITVKVISDNECNNLNEKIQNSDSNSSRNRNRDRHDTLDTQDSRNESPIPIAHIDLDKECQNLGIVSDSVATISEVPETDCLPEMDGPVNNLRGYDSFFPGFKGEIYLG